MAAIAAVAANMAKDTAAIVADDRLAQVSVCQMHDMIIVAIDVGADDRQLPLLCLPRTSIVDSRS